MPSDSSGRLDDFVAHPQPCLKGEHFSSLRPRGRLSIAGRVLASQDAHACARGCDFFVGDRRSTATPRLHRTTRTMPCCRLGPRWLGRPEDARL